jgi:C-terminal processing protease CtpA/Prc
MRVAHLAAVLIVALGLGTGAAGLSEPQAPTGDERAMLQAMLKAGYETVRDHYFDRTFNGVSWDARYAQYQARLATVPTLHAGLLTVADMIDGLGDSHTRFYPPGWLRHVDYGYDLVAIGQRLHVGAVRPSTDAATKLHPGDLVTALNAEPITRQSLPRVRYVLGSLTPLAETRLTLRDPDGRERNVDVKSTVTEGRTMRLLGGAIKSSDFVRAEQEAEFALRGRSVSVGNVLVWKMPQFISDLGDINRVADIALKHQAVVLDLRGNPGGYVDALRRLTSVLFSGDIAVGTQVERRGPTAIKVSPRRNRTFDGRLIVLIDSESASSSEIIARIVQLEGPRHRPGRHIRRRRALLRDEALLLRLRRANAVRILCHGGGSADARWFIPRRTRSHAGRTGAADRRRSRAGARSRALACRRARRRLRSTLLSPANSFADARPGDTPIADHSAITFAVRVNVQTLCTLTHKVAGSHHRPSAATPLLAGK